MPKRRSGAIRTSSSGRSVRLELTGDVDIASAPELRDALLAACLRRPKLVVVDLAEVSFMDATGLGVVVAARRRLQEQRARLEIVNVPPTVHRLVSMLGLDLV